MDVSYDDPMEDRRPGISRTLEEVKDNFAKLGAQLRELNQRLGPVTLPADPSPVANDQAIMAAVKDRRSPLMSALTDHIAEIREMQGKVASLMERLEI